MKNYLKNMLYLLNSLFDELEDAFYYMFYETTRLERAMYNPENRKIVREAVDKLIRNPDLKSVIVEVDGNKTKITLIDQ